MIEFIGNNIITERQKRHNKLLHYIQTHPTTDEYKQILKIQKSDISINEKYENIFKLTNKMYENLKQDIDKYEKMS